MSIKYGFDFPLKSSFTQDEVQQWLYNGVNWELNFSGVKMGVVAFLLFLVGTLYYVWNGNDDFNKGKWFQFFLKFIAAFIGIFILGFIFKGVTALIPAFSNKIAGGLLMKVFMSIFSVLGMKFVVVMAYTMFSRIMVFHRKYNVENYDKLSSFAYRLAPGLLLLAKILVSLGGILVFYGIWLA
ncbi:hypothetical protein [Erwinia pyrifoliae]|uniref:Yip1 domain-containing protein n=1 Tax=Erwinia pyrifoliae TaxID=79967 RepID=A0ABY5X6A2_ERWPY|nr:hypothetical protein [Erwinia pyrifoliae]MCU8585964.1 hypothetical protein [Erwinia pyrifoliae]UWS32886.1 hypothetical protein NYP84_14895 [Erwinia pyrifoliae]